jgi:hypothetical protein
MMQSHHFTFDYWFAVTSGSHVVFEFGIVGRWVNAFAFLGDPVGPPHEFGDPFVIHAQ